MTLVAAEGQLYAIGGMLDGGYTSTVEVYNPLLDEWIVIDPMTQSRCYPGVVYSNGRIYVVGGMGDCFLGDSGPMKTVEFYDIAAGTWTAMASMAFCRHSPAVTVARNRLYVFGGGETSTVLVCSGPEKFIEYYDFEQNDWSILCRKVSGLASTFYACATFTGLSQTQ